MSDGSTGRRVVIDAHMHVDDVPALGWHFGADLCIERMDEAGIDRAVVMTITDLPEVNSTALELIAEAVAQYPDRLYGFARIHPWYAEAVSLLEYAFAELGFKGLKLHPVTTSAHPAGEDTVRLIRKAAEHGAPVLVHCGDEPLSTPLAIAQAARRCPEATLILGHMGGYAHVDEAIEVAEDLANVVLETSAFPFPEKIRQAVERIGGDRVLFGSDGPACSPLLELEKVRLAGLPPDTERLVLGANVKRLLEAVR